MNLGVSLPEQSLRSWGSKLLPRLRSARWVPAGQSAMPKFELQMPKPDKPEITNYRHHLILKLGQINYNIQIRLRRVKRRLFGILNLGHWDLPFDLAQGGKVVSPSTLLRTVSLSNGLSNHLIFVICYLKFFNYWNLNTETKRSLHHEVR